MTQTGIYMETSKLNIRGYEMSDASNLFQLVDRNKEILTECLPLTAAKNASTAGTEEYIYQSQNEGMQGRSFTNGIFLKSKNQLIGQIAIYSIDWNIPKAEIAFFVDIKYQNKGYAKEALTAITHHCFSNLKMCKIYLRIVPGSDAAVSVSNYCKFKQIGTMQNELKTLSGKLLPTIYFELLPENILTPQ